MNFSGLWGPQGLGIAVKLESIGCIGDLSMHGVPSGVMWALGMSLFRDGSNHFMVLFSSHYFIRIHDPHHNEEESDPSLVHGAPGIKKLPE